MPTYCFTGVCKESVRLVDGESERAGTVEVCQNGLWVPVCSDQWDTPDATVVCRQLGYYYNGEITCYINGCMLILAYSTSKTDFKLW